MSALDIVTAVLVLGGSTLALTAAIGVVRFPDTLTRMHAATKPQVLGLLLVLAGAAIRLRGNVDVGMVILTGLFTLITAPVVANRVGQLAYREQNIRDDLLTKDEMREFAGNGEDRRQWPELTTTAGTSPRASARPHSVWRWSRAGETTIELPTVHRPLRSAVSSTPPRSEDGGYRRRTWSSGFAQHRRLRRIAHQVVRRVLHRGRRKRYRAGGHPRRRAWTRGRGGCRGWTTPWSTRSTSPRCWQFKAADAPRQHDVSPGLPLRRGTDRSEAGLAESVARTAGFDPAEPTAWAAEGLLPYLPADGQDLLFERINELSARGSRIGVESFGAGFFDRDYLASRREQMRRLREEAGEDPDEKVPDTQDLWYIEDRTDVADWLTEHNWEVSAVESTRPHDAIRPLRTPGQDDATAPRTVFIEGRLTC